MTRLKLLQSHKDKLFSGQTYFTVYKSGVVSTPLENTIAELYSILSAGTKDFYSIGNYKCFIMYSLTGLECIFYIVIGNFAEDISADRQDVKMDFAIHG